MGEQLVAGVRRGAGLAQAGAATAARVQGRAPHTASLALEPLQLSVYSATPSSSGEAPAARSLHASYAAEGTMSVLAPAPLKQGSPAVNGSGGGSQPASSPALSASAADSQPACSPAIGASPAVSPARGGEQLRRCSTSASEDVKAVGGGSLLGISPTPQSASAGGSSDSDAPDAAQSARSSGASSSDGDERASPLHSAHEGGASEMRAEDEDDPLALSTGVSELAAGGLGAGLHISSGAHV